MKRIYLDYNASTPIDPVVATAMNRFLENYYGNPSSGHWASTEAKAALDIARGQVAALLGCHNDEIVFTSGGSEANNFALKGAYFALRDKGDHIITTRIEHPAIIEPCRFLERLGARVTHLPVDGTGRIDPNELRKAITPRTILVSIMHANNEVGTIEPIEDCARIARDIGTVGGSRGFDRFGMSFRAHRAVTGSGSYGHCTRDRDGHYAVQPRAHNDTGRNRCGRRTSD